MLQLVKECVNFQMSPNILGIMGSLYLSSICSRWPRFELALLFLCYEVELAVLFDVDVVKRNDTIPEKVSHPGGANLNNGKNL